MMKHLITKAGIFAVLAFVLASLSISAFADCFDDGFNAGQSAGIQQGIDIGIQQCKDNPGDYGLVKSDAVTQAEQNGIDIGIQQCKDNPESCGLVKSDAITQAGIDEGKKQCRENPATEGCEGLVKSDAITQAGMDEGKKQCRDNPATEGCEGLVKSDAITQAGMDEGKKECQNDPSACFSDSPSQMTSPLTQEPCEKKTQNCVSMTDDKLYLPVIGMGKDGKTVSVVKNVEMDWWRKQGNAGSNQISIPLVFVYNYKAEDDVKETVTLTIKPPTQAGQVISYPVGINCGRDCTEVYEIGNFVNLFAVPQNYNTVFTGWNGDVVGCGGKTNHIVVWMDVDGECAATFAAIDSGDFSAPIAPFKLRVGSNHETEGTVTREPLGTDCDEDDCTAKYESGIEVTLTATPTTDFKFMGWAGSSGCGDKVTMNTDFDCTAIFSPAH